MLEYERKQAPLEKGIIRNCLKSGIPYPKAIADAPELEDGNYFFFAAFMLLGSCRRYELGPIPYDIILDYCHKLELDEEQEERMISVLTQVDEWWRGEIWAEIKAE